MPAGGRAASAVPDKTPLERLLEARIAADGPMTVAEVMALCLGHPEHGYYMAGQPFGASGDFVTAPEISQIFGEMIGVWASAVWQSMGRPERLRLVELGPGRGTLMADLIRVAAQTGLADAAEVWMIETSPRLVAEQRRQVPKARHAARLDKVPKGPMLLVANEFLDALPMRQFIAGAEGWHERCVGLVDGRLAFGLAPALPGAAAEGAWVERSTALEQVTAEVAARLAAEGGAALFIDYGYRANRRPAGPTLQAVHRHRKVDPLHRPGETDLTWLIDFDGLAQALSPLHCRIAPQGDFLAQMGVGHRAAQLASATPGEAEAIADALERLTGPGTMGRLFHVLGAAPAGAPPLPGFGDTG